MNEPENYLFSHLTRIENEMSVICKEAKRNRRTISDIVAFGFVGILANYFVYKAMDTKIQKLEKEISEKNTAKAKEE